MNREEWLRHAGKIVGLAVGFILGVVYLIGGFWDMLVFGLLLFLGYFFGKRADEGEPPVDWAFWAERLGERWRRFR
mgnify:CR=1 FL=1